MKIIFSIVDWNIVKQSHETYSSCVNILNALSVSSYPLPDGTVVRVNFVADENGFQAESPFIPAIPPHAQEQILRANEDRARGITYDDFGRRVTR